MNFQGDGGFGAGPSTVEAVVGRTLATLLAERRMKAADLERRLDLPGGSLDDLLAGRGSLDMDSLRRVLTFLGLAPESFFARVFAQGGGAASSPEAPGRHQVAGLLDRVRSALLEISPSGSAPRT